MRADEFSAGCGGARVPGVGAGRQMDLTLV